jgi:chromosome segregation protein
MTANSHEKIREESRLAQIMQDIARCVGRIGMQKAESEQLAKQREEIVREADMMDKESVVIEEEISVLKSELEKIEITNKEEQESRDELRELISDLKLSVNSIEESLIAAKEMTERIDKEKQSFINNIEKRKEEQKKSDSDINALELKNNELIVLIEAKSEQRDKITDEINALSNEKNEHDEKMSTFYDRFEELSNKISELTLELGKSEVKKGRMETALDEVKNKLWEQYELTYDNAQKWKMDIDNPTAALKRVNELKTSIKSLGDINVNSIEEYDKVSERYEFLKKQRDDIELSKQKLLKMITDLTEEMRKQFISHFRIINENFKVVFSELFGGGMAEIILSNEDDVLTCNIDIHAQPPGKKLQNMLLLSGGERCLTAIALLFAILKLRPSPFCVLDEIEAALDDANIVRFSEYIRNYSEESQFILVTHRKGTMESADMIYGVTMQERGISKILSMRLSD